MSECFVAGKPLLTPRREVIGRGRPIFAKDVAHVGDPDGSATLKRLIERGFVVRGADLGIIEAAGEVVSPPAPGARS